jgi:hypothetical protein
VKDVLTPHVMLLVGAEVDRSASALMRSGTGGEDERLIANGREIDAIALDKVELDLRTIRLIAGSGEVDRLLVTVFCRDNGRGGVFPAENGVTGSLGARSVEGPFDEPKEPEFPV